jgi:hypothetical protein
MLISRERRTGSGQHVERLVLLEPERHRVEPAHQADGEVIGVPAREVDGGSVQ